MSGVDNDVNTVPLPNIVGDDKIGSYYTKKPINQSLENPVQEYNVYEQAYDYFNQQLFHGQLPKCLITLQRRRGARGYYAPERFVARHRDKATTDEIALNPDTFANRTDKEILSTLVHEACHLYQAHYGKPGRRGYHNREWARYMLSAGLRPISFDQPGKMTGQSVTHEILPGGRFDQSADQLLASGFSLNWQSALQLGYGLALGDKSIIQQDTSKVKYQCPNCRANAWAKPHSNLLCTLCFQKYVESYEHWMYADEIMSIASRFVMRPSL